MTQTPIDKVRDALEALIKTTENYVEASEEFLSDTNFDESGWLAESHAALKVTALRAAKAALTELDGMVLVKDWRPIETARG